MKLLLLFTFVFIVRADKHLNANGPFGKRHKVADEPNPYLCNRATGITTSAVFRSTGDIQQLNVSKTLYNTKDIIQVTWSPLSNPCKDDFVAIYFTDVPLEDACDYFDYEFVQQHQSSASWQMINLRRPLDFRYYSRDHSCSGNYSIVGRSTVVQPINYNEPVHIHIAYADRIDQMYVSYLTNSSAVLPQCQYGLNPSALTMQQNGTTTTYTASDMCEGKATEWSPQAFIDPGFMHTMLLEGLLPSTTYYYRVGSDLHGWSSIYSFRNRPSTSDEAVNIIAYGDMGFAPVEPGAKGTIDRLTARVSSSNITCLLHIGDISYARGVGALWDAFMSQVQPIAAVVPYMTGIGNHEYDHVTGGDKKDPSGALGPGGFRPGWGDYGTDSGGECAVPMVHRFHSPSNGNGLFWYSFDVGPVHVIYFSTEHDFRQSSVQYNWLEEDLRSVNRTRTPWLIVGAHRHMFTSEVESVGEGQIRTMLQMYLEPIFYQYRVDINLFAHRHSYERSCPMFQRKCVSDGITHVLIGMAGQDLDTGVYTSEQWSKYHDQQFGYTTIYANRTYLHFRYHHDKDDLVADEFILTK